MVMQFFWNNFLKSICSLLYKLPNGGKHAVVVEGRSSQDNLKCARKESEPKLFTSIASNKNGHESNKNLEATTDTTSGQLPNKTVDAMVYVEMNSMPPFKMGSKICQHTKGASRHLRKLGPKSLSKTCMRAKSNKKNHY